MHDRLKSVLSGQPATAKAVSPAVEADDPDHSKATSAEATTVAPAKKPPAEAAPNEQVEGDDAPAPETDPQESADDVPLEDDAQIDPAKLRTLNELADATGLEAERLMDLELPVKIDGKSGTARLRDLVKSYQLDGHINQKLATFDNDRKSWETKRAEGERAVVERLVRLDAGVKTLERALESEFSGIDWQKLAAESPVDYNSKWVQYQQRYAVLNDIATQIGNEQKQYQETQAAKAKEFLEEQRKLAEAKIPEYADAAKRAQFKQDAVEYLKGYGLTQPEFESVSDHRMLLVVRDALNWAKLQKSKPATLNKVRAAPKLLKPGTTQSRAATAQIADKTARDRLKQTGKVSDAAALLRRRFAPQRAT